MNHQQMLKPMLVGAGLLVVLAVAGLPVGNLIPFLVFLACPLMMIFMMRGMNHGGSSCSHDEHSHDKHSHADQEPSEKP